MQNTVPVSGVSPKPLLALYTGVLYYFGPFCEILLEKGCKSFLL
jgi:hypothetical protein